MIKIATILLLVFIVVNLFFGLINLMRDKSRSNRVARSLTIRVVLSIALFLLIVVGLHFGQSPRGQ